MADSSDTILGLLPSWQLHMRAKNRSPKTVAGYSHCLKRFTDSMGDLPASEVDRRMLERYLADVLSRSASSTARKTHNALTQFFRWAEIEGEVEESPMLKVEAPRVTEKVVPVLSEAQVKALLKACEGSSFYDKRDEAIIRLFLDSGMRLGEMAGLKLDDVRVFDGVALVTGKGRRQRVVPFSPKTAAALDRYLRQRARHRYASLEGFWLSEKGELSEGGCHQLLRKRGRLAGIPKLHAHQFRHSFAHQWLSRGGNESDLMRLAGWNSSQMLRRYGASAASERALEAYRRLDLWQ